MMRFDSVRRTTSSRTLGGTRIALGVLFLTTGIMKLTVPMLWNAFDVQLTEAGIPSKDLNLWAVPLIEIAVGGLLAAGYLARLGAAMVVPIMLVATYVHSVVDHPDAFPLQPSAPIIPLIVLPLAALVAWKGAGAWSLDLSATRGIGEPGPGPDTRSTLGS